MDPNAPKHADLTAPQILISEGYDKTMALKALFVKSFEVSLDIRPARHWLDLHYPSKKKDYTKAYVVL